ncbi:TetR family transcriptional regulator, partial [Oleiphilus sp. HI0065]
MSDKDSAQKTGKIREQNRKNILAAAEDSFVKNGFKGTSMQSIADAAELPKANVLYYFKSKQALYLAVLDEIIRRWDESIDDMSEGDDPAEVLGNYIRAKVDLAIQYPNASKIFALEIIQGAPNLQDHLRSNLRAWVRDKSKIIQSWIDQGKMNAVDPEHLIFMIWSTTQHYADFDTQILTVTNKLE